MARSAHGQAYKTSFPARADSGVEIFPLKGVASDTPVGLPFTVAKVKWVVNGDANSAPAILTEARQWAEKASSKDHPHIATTMGLLATSLCSLGQNKGALKLREGKPVLRKQIQSKDHPSVASFVLDLAVSFTSLGRYKEALALEGRDAGITERGPTEGRSIDCDVHAQHFPVDFGVGTAQGGVGTSRRGTSAHETGPAEGPPRHYEVHGRHG